MSGLFPSRFWQPTAVKQGEISFHIHLQFNSLNYKVRLIIMSKCNFLPPPPQQNSVLPGKMNDFLMLFKEIIAYCFVLVRNLVADIERGK